MVRTIGFSMSFGLAMSAWVVWVVIELHQWAIFAEEPGSSVGRWLQILAGIGIMGSGVLIIALLLLIWKPWKE